jgi:hypothetical protein
MWQLEAVTSEGSAWLCFCSMLAGEMPAFRISHAVNIQLLAASINHLIPAALPAGLAQEQVRDVVGHLLYFSLLLLMSLATIIICVTKSVQGQKVHSRFLLPAAWALYNAVGPVLFFCAATLKKTKSLELAMYLLSMVRGCMHGAVQHKLAGFLLIVSAA